MNLKSVDYIITAKHMSRTGKAEDWTRQLLDEIRKKRGVNIEIHTDVVSGLPVLARIHRGRWIADCDVCSGAMFVDPDYPLFFCCSCFNRTNNSNMRPVQFPPEVERVEIEKMILARPVNDVVGVTDEERAAAAIPVIGKELPDRKVAGLYREWLPHETVADLKEQNKLVDRWKDELRSGKGGANGI